MSDGNRYGGGSGFSRLDQLLSDAVAILSAPLLLAAGPVVGASCHTNPNVRPIDPPKVRPESDVLENLIAVQKRARPRHNGRARR